VSTSGISSVLTNINNAFSGKTSGIDVAATVSALMELQRAPEAQMQSQQAAVTTRISILGALAGELSQLQSAANALKDSFGALSQKTVTSSNPSIVTATAQYSAPSGTHTILVTQLATVSSSYSDPIADASILAGTSFQIAYGDPNNPTKIDNITLPDTIKTLQDAADAINHAAENTGVSASVIKDANGERLALVSNASGKDGNLTVTSAAPFHQGVEGKNANLTIDGVPVESASNTVSEALPGVTLQLANADSNTKVQIGIAPDTTEAAKAINDFITAYNNAVKDINAQFSADSSGNAGPLAGDASLRTLQSQLLDIAGYAPGGDGPYVNLQSLGIEMQNDGTLQMNSTVLEDVLTNHYTDFQNFFQSASPDAYGQTIGKMLQQITDPVQGTVASDISGQKAEGANLTLQINDFEDHMAAVEQQLTAEYSRLNVLLQQYPMQIQQINSQLSALNPNNKG
jgi:flagellar hook-associated protein 2